MLINRYCSTVLYSEDPNYLGNRLLRSCTPYIHLESRFGNYNGNGVNAQGHCTFPKAS